MSPSIVRKVSRDVSPGGVFRGALPRPASGYLRLDILILCPDLAPGLAERLGR